MKNGGARGRKAPPSSCAPAREEERPVAISSRPREEERPGPNVPCRSGCGGSREEVGTAAGPMALREEEEGLSHVVEAGRPLKFRAATPGRRRGSPLVRWPSGRRRRACRTTLRPEGPGNFGRRFPGGGGNRRRSDGPREEEGTVAHRWGRVPRKGCGGSWEEERNRRFSVSPGRRRGTSDLSWKHTQERGFRIKVRRCQGGGEAPPLLL